MEEIIEEWRDVVGFEGKYQVSNLGQVKSLRDKYGNYREKILRQGKLKNGYLLVQLCKEGKGKTIKVHRLVAQAFIENPSNLPCVNHKDENKENNCVDNLEWCDHKYNANYKNAQAKRVASRDYKELAEKLSRQVYQYNKQGKLIKIWQSTNEAGRNGFDSSNVSKCCRGKIKHYKNYIWNYTPIDYK